MGGIKNFTLNEYPLNFPIKANIAGKINNILRKIVLIVSGCLFVIDYVLKYYFPNLHPVNTSVGNWKLSFRHFKQTEYKSFMKMRPEVNNIFHEDKIYKKSKGG